ncbi:N-acetyltransferase ESCO2 [Wickerhamomyces ciferrii]|uniref:N-acetyltransferase ECO1 n=1 Tax=Wickerhamomyces ciferrii (strain ATCC 14091 / BCRC 22168 / CBS 111 / JCM 3599 / NBRC 0793 / NRRL Y-1031 F-60-10) TaxID=1206466 RepID=K0KXM2_WICCF|nr:N-acetyltransferase ESCO2 [Wickerhamomyces ciferrii]CCH46772.1 N-acetyltransferase ESCO2 [Wickerhamomyces ciferrii]
MKSVYKINKTRKNESNITKTPLQDITTIIKNNVDSDSSIPSTPNSSQSQSITSTPQTSPLPTTQQQKNVKIRHATKQSVLSFGIDERKQCQECGMSYLKYVQSDVKSHQKYHQKCLNGRDWNDKWGKKLIEFNQNEYICTLNLNNSSEIKASLELLEIVNQNLNAPDDNEFWLKGTDSGKIFIYVKDKKAVGIVSTEKITKGHWFAIDDGVVINKIDIELLAGINRIYVSKNHRRFGIALKLLKCAQEHMIYGMVIPKHKIGWSQPSFSGGKFAKTFNGVKHKSGKILIPVYT